MPRTPKLRTYDAAVEELGGRPWLPKPDTDAWFLVDAATIADAATVARPDSGLFETDLKKRMSVTTKLCILLVALLVAIAVVAANL